MAFSPGYNAEGIEYYEIPSFQFTDGTTILVRVAYRSINPGSSKKAVVPTCYGGVINGTCTMTGAGEALEDYHVITVAMLGNGESTSPSNTPSFPSRLYYQDVVKSQYLLVTEHLKFKELDVVMGFSMGGQQTYYWAAMYPSFVHNAIPICGSARTSGHNYCFLEGPKAALLDSVDYAEYNSKLGNERERPTKGLTAFARVYSAWVVSGAWFRERQWEKMGSQTVEQWIGSFTEGFLGWAPEDLLILLRMWQYADVGSMLDGEKPKSKDEPNPTIRQAGAGELEAYEEVLKSQIKARVLVMPGRTDQYFAWEDSETEAKLLGQKGELAIIESVWGHVSGSGSYPPDREWMSRRISQFLAKESR